MDILVFVLKALLIPLALYLLCLRFWHRNGRTVLRGKLYVLGHVVLAAAFLRLGLLLGEMPDTASIVRLTRGVFYFTLCWTGIKTLEVTLFENKRDDRLPHFPVFFRDIVRFFLLSFIAIVLLKLVFDVDPSALVVTSTVMSAIIGLALQDMLTNFIAGVALQMERPFQTGHWVVVGGREGRVLQMSWRTTSLYTRQGDVVAIPNATLAREEILNYYEPERRHMVHQNIGLAYQHAPGLVKSVLLKTIEQTKGILQQPPAEVFLINYNNSSIDYQMRFWIDDVAREPALRDAVMSRIWYALRREGISIPFPIRDVFIHDAEERNQHLKDERRAAEGRAIERMRQVEMLSAFSEDQLSELAGQLRFCLYAEGEYLVKQGEKESTFFIINSGQVSVYVKGMDGRKELVGSFGPGYFFGEIALCTGARRTASVIAGEQVEALVIDKEAFGTVLEEHPEMAVQLSEILEKRAAELRALLAERPRDMPPQEGEDLGMLERIQRFFNL